MHDANDDAIALRLDQLEALPTVSSFSHALYELMAELVSMTETTDASRLALVGLLDVELRYHAEMQRFGERVEVSVADLQGLADRHRIGLQAVREFSGKLPPAAALSEAARWLVVAECCYHLSRTHEVVEALEEVVHLGVNQPLVQFALGHNRYMQALEDFTRPEGNGGELVISNPLGFQLQCLQAVAAMEDGLGNPELDDQLYWWMGVILEAAGLTEAAQDAYDKSALATDGAPKDDAQSGFGSGGWQGVDGAITAEEVQAAAELLKGRFDPADLLPNGPEDRN